MPSISDRLRALAIDPPKRVLLLVDGNEVLPNQSQLRSGAKGGKAAAHRLHEAIRRWTSSEMGEECSTSILLFADLAYLRDTLRLPLETLADFARGFSSASVPSAMIDMARSSSCSSLHGHLAWHLPSVDVVLLAGFGSSNEHAYRLSQLEPCQQDKLVLLETEKPVLPVVAKIAVRNARLEGLVAVGRSPSTLSASTPSIAEEVEDDDASRTTSGSGRGEESRLPESPRVVPLYLTSLLPLTVAVSAADSIPASPSTISSAASPPSKPPPPLVRPPDVPPQYLPLLQIVSSLEKNTPSGSAPLWSAVGNELQKSQHKGKYGKLRTYLLAAEREGWVKTGAGGSEGTEWIKVSARGARAMKKGAKGGK
ncbi:hypothetical protein JCM10213_003687 [Rhodosporidiobolus nylandii]